MSDTTRSLRRRAAGGMTLVETTIALVILSVGILAMFAAQITALDQTSQGRHTTEAAQVARDQMEFLQRLPWTHASVQPSGAWYASRTLSTKIRQSGVDVLEQDFAMDYRVTASAIDADIRTIDVRVQWTDDDSGGAVNRVFTMSGLKVEEFNP
jgi:Tfp pilus assembly protein PilV